MPAAEPEPAIDAETLRRLFSPFEHAAGIGLAVSGGPDSLALAWLAAHWRKGLAQGPRLVVLTVDHGLRPESAAEAEGVARIAASLGLECRVLKREGDAPEADIEAAARAARYRLLFDAARQDGLSHVATAHHRDDQAETLLLRLARGSGVYGLAAMPRHALRDGIHLVRPLLDLSRARLAAVAREAGFDAVDDPHNRDLRFARSRIRALAPTLAAEGLTGERLAATAGRLRRAASALDHYAGRLLEQAASVDAFGAVELESSSWAAEPEEVRLRALARILRAAGGAEHVPRLDALAGLEAALRAGDPAARTLGGVRVSSRGGRIRFEREQGREGLPALPVRGPFDAIWDRRFRVSGDTGGIAAVLGALGEAGRLQLPAELRSGPRGAIAATPALWSQGRILGTPASLPLRDQDAGIAFQAEAIVAGRMAEAVAGDDS